MASCNLIAQCMTLILAHECRRGDPDILAEVKPLDEFDWSKRACHHGKGVVDAGNAIVKEGLRTGEKRGCGPLNNAERCTAYCNKHLFQPDPNQDPTKPKKPRKGCHHKTQRATFHETLEGDLEQRRARQPAEVTPIAGTQRFHQYRFLRREGNENVVMVRWLSCTCGPCSARHWDGCINKHLVGEWHEVRQVQTDQRGTSGPQGIRRGLSNKIADNLDKAACHVVAVFTKEDGDHKFWLARPVSKSWVVPENSTFECPVSGEEFGQGERVIKVKYFDRLDHAPEIFRLREDLGVVCIPTSMLRVGPEHKIDLTARASRPDQDARNIGVSAGAATMYNLGAKSKKHIIDVIENVFKDKSH